MHGVEYSKYLLTGETSLQVGKAVIGPKVVQDGIGEFLSPTEYERQVRDLFKRQPDSEELKWLCVLLLVAFHERVLLKVAIERNGSIRFYLSRKKRKGSGEHLAGGALKQFVELFSEATGQQLKVAWFDSSGGLSSRSAEGRRGSGGMFDLLLDALEAAKEVVVVGAALKILLGDD